MHLKYLITNDIDLALKHGNRSYSVVFTEGDLGLTTIKRTVPVQTAKQNNYFLGGVRFVVLNSKKELEEFPAEKKKANCTRKVIHLCRFDISKEKDKHNLIQASGRYAYCFSYSHDKISLLEIEAQIPTPKKITQKKSVKKGRKNANKPVQKSNKPNKANG